MGIIVDCGSILAQEEEKEVFMLKILSLDPSGNGTTGLCLIKGDLISFQAFQHKD
jgi:hypothetical protein